MFSDMIVRSRGSCINATSLPTRSQSKHLNESTVDIPSVYRSVIRDPQSIPRFLYLANIK
jgi:hypothetical protein